MIASILYYKVEGFDKTGTVFQPVGSIQYDLRGAELDTQPIEECYFDQFKCYQNTSQIYY